MIMTSQQLSTLLISLMVLSFVFLSLAYWLSRNADHIKFRIGFEENERRPARNSFLSTLITNPDPNRIWGIDESGRWAGVVDWKVTRSRGASFAIIKATEGTVHSAYFHENLDGVLAAGMVGAAYHWLHRNSTISCRLQAEAAWNRVKGYAKILPLFVDFETTYWNRMQANPNYTDLDLFVTEYTRLSGRKPFLYSSQGYMGQFGQIPAALKAKFAGLWIANYKVNAPNLPLGYTGWQFWQFSAEGDAAHLTPNTLHKKEVDLNYFNGTLSSLYALAGLGDAPPPPQPEPETGETMQARVKTFTNMRAFRNINSADVGDFEEGDIITYDGNNFAGLDGRLWAYATDATRNGEPVRRTDGKTVKEEPVYIYYPNIENLPADPQPSAVGRVVISIEAKIYDAAGVLVGSKVIELDELLEGIN